MTKPNIEWEKEFERKFGDFEFVHKSGNKWNQEPFKDFIETLLAQQRHDQEILVNTILETKNNVLAQQSQLLKERIPEAVTNFMQVGKIIACGHCRPNEFAIDQYHKCECVCHNPSEQGIDELVRDLTSIGSKSGVRERLLELKAQWEREERERCTKD